MALHEQFQKLAEATLGAYCSEKVLVQIRGKIRLTFSVLSHTLTLLVGRPVANNLGRRSKRPLAQFRVRVVDPLWRLSSVGQKEQNGWELHRGAQP